MNKLKAKAKSPKPRTWPTNCTCSVDYSSDRTSSCSHRPTSPPQGKPHRSETDWYQKVSVCHLECPSKGVCCQCVIVKLCSDLKSALHINDSHPLTLALIAPHTFLHSTRDLRDWRLQTGADGVDKSTGLKLHEKNFSRFYTCCGPEGVWGGSNTHAGKYVDESSCPFQGNFTVLILKQELTTQLKDVLTIPYLPRLDENTFSQSLRNGNHCFTLIQRRKMWAAEAHKVLMRVPSFLQGSNLSIDNRIAAYEETAQLHYTCGHVSFFDVSSAGAGVVYFDQTTSDNALMLAAIHLYSRRDDDVIVHCGISLPAIFHAIAGSQVCGVVPCLSLLVGACNRKVWRPSFYQYLQDCLLPQNDPEDKQKRYHWSSRLLAVCDYLCREESHSTVLKLDVQDNPQAVLTSLNLLSALLGCFQRVIDMEGVSQFHCQITRVFPKKASERFFGGLESMFERLYKHLVHSGSGDDVIAVCVECWLKMCTLAGTKKSAFYEVAKFTRVKVLRDSPRFRDNAHFQRLFGDLCLAFLTHTRSTLHDRSMQEQDCSGIVTRLHQAEQEKQALQEKVDRLHQELSEQTEALQRLQCSQPGGSECRLTNGVNHDPEDVEVFLTPCRPGLPVATVSPSVSPQVTRRQVSSVLRFDSEISFWDRDMSSLLESDCWLREKIGRVFQKVKGAVGNGTWEHLAQFLEERLDARDSFMCLDKLEALKVSDGDRVLLIVQEWARREEVTAGQFCDVSGKVGNGNRVQDILSLMEKAEREKTLPSFPEHCSFRNSRVTTI